MIRMEHSLQTTHVGESTCIGQPVTIGRPESVSTVRHNNYYPTGVMQQSGIAIIGWVNSARKAFTLLFFLGDGMHLLSMVEAKLGKPRSQRGSWLHKFVFSKRRCSCMESKSIDSQYHSNVSLSNLVHPLFE